MLHKTDRKHCAFFFPETHISDRVYQNVRNVHEYRTLKKTIPLKDWVATRAELSGEKRLRCLDACQVSSKKRKEKKKKIKGRLTFSKKHQDWMAEQVVISQEALLDEWQRLDSLTMTYKSTFWCVCV